MATKTKKEKALKLDRKTFDSLMNKREDLVKEIARRKNKLAKVDTDLAKFADWLKSLAAPQS